jgi:hypothetical protein
MNSPPKTVVVTALVAAVVCCLGVGAAVGSSGPRRLPVIGCDDLSKPYANHYAWRYAPTNYCGFKRGLGVNGIDHTKWQGWGNAQATGRGYVLVYDGSFAEFPASLTAYGFWSTNQFLGTNEYMSTYTKLRVHVLARRAPSAVSSVYRGPINFTVNVQIQE